MIDGFEIKCRCGEKAADIKGTATSYGAKVRVKFTCLVCGYEVEVPVTQAHIHDFEIVGKNVDAAILRINHSDLQRLGEGVYKSQCPVCEEGVLLVRRNQKTFEIESRDRCLFCGQEVEYLDLPKK